MSSVKEGRRLIGLPQLWPLRLISLAWRYVRVRISQEIRGRLLLRFVLSIV